MSERTVDVLIADDHPFVRLGVRTLLTAQPDFRVVGEATDGDEAIHLAQQLKPDVLVLDLAMPRLPGLDALREVTAGTASVKTILLTSAIKSRQVLEALQLGARGVVRKDAVTDDLVNAIRTVVGGQHWLGGRVVTELVQALMELMAEAAPVAPKTFGLSPRELEVVALVVEGGTNKDFGSKLGISEETVKRHLTHIFDKAGVSSRLELAMFALNHGLSRQETPRLTRTIPLP